MFIFTPSKPRPVTKKVRKKVARKVSRGSSFRNKDKEREGKTL